MKVKVAIIWPGSFYPDDFWEREKVRDTRSQEYLDYLAGLFKEIENAGEGEVVIKEWIE